MTRSNRQLKRMKSQKFNSLERTLTIRSRKLSPGSDTSRSGDALHKSAAASGQLLDRKQRARYIFSDLNISPERKRTAGGLYPFLS